MLIDIYNDDSRVRLGSSTQLKSEVEAIEFQPRDEIENRHGALAHECRDINGKRRDGDDATNNERGFVTPPFLQKSGAFNLSTFKGQGHEFCGVAKKQKSRKANKRVPVIQVSIASKFIRRPAILRRLSGVAIGPLCSFPCFRYTVARALVSGIAMSGKKQIWYLEGSAAEKLAAPLRTRYDLRPVSQNKKGALRGAEATGNGVPTVWLADMKASGKVLQARAREGRSKYRIIGIFPANGNSSAKARRARSSNDRSSVFAFLPSNAPRNIVEKTLEAAFENIDLVERDRAGRRTVKTWEREREELNEIGVALSSQREIGALLTLILSKTREITAADAGSLYLVEQDSQGQHLRFMLTQNDSLEFPYQEFVLPMAENSMAGYTALRGEVLNFPDAYKIPAGHPFRFNNSYDRDSGYHTRSLLTLPMRNAKGEVLGVLQLINCKRNRAARLLSAKDVAKYVQPFRERSVRLALSLASQAAVAYENRKLYNEIETLLEGFVSAAVTAIEQRDPTTSGHSLRVSAYTQSLAAAVNATSSGPYAGTFFDAEQLKEIRYAALLHDFGKVGVREEVLVKAKKLYPLQLDVLRQRFDYIRKETEAGNVRRKLQVYLEHDRGDALSEIARLSEDFDQRLKRIEEYLQFIIEANEPTLLEQHQFQKLREIAQQSFLDPRGIERPYLNPGEIKLLSIPKGSLDPSERLEIESHVIHTFNFLSQIPWTKSLQKVPEIARAHHEKLNGTGYPYKLRGDQIPLPTKMMTICDIFDALTASDRPYKRAVPIPRALSILEDCVRASELDPDLFRVFHEEKIYERVMPPTAE
jgi:HD-GYP domain-containing protein (c-di-GMP phosphodiesterase class II)